MILNAQGREVNGNGVDLTERQKAKIMAQNATVADVNEIANAHAVQATNHLGNQLPAFVHKIVAEAIQGFYASLLERGMLLEPREPVTPQPPESAVSVEKDGDAN